MRRLDWKKEAHNNSETKYTSFYSTFPVATSHTLKTWTGEEETESSHTRWETDSLTETHSPPRSTPLPLRRRRRSPSARRVQGHAVKRLERTQCVLFCSQTAANSQLELKSAHKVVIYKSLMVVSSTALDGWQQYFSDGNKNDVTDTIHKKLLEPLYTISTVTHRLYSSERLGFFPLNS